MNNIGKTKTDSAMLTKIWFAKSNLFWGCFLMVLMSLSHRNTTFTGTASNLLCIALISYIIPSLNNIAWSAFISITYVQNQSLNVQLAEDYSILALSLLANWTQLKIAFDKENKWFNIVLISLREIILLSIKIIKETSSGVLIELCKKVNTVNFSIHSRSSH